MLLWSLVHGYAQLSIAGLFAEHGATGAPKLPIDAIVPRFGYRGRPGSLRVSPCFVSGLVLRGPLACAAGARAQQSRPAATVSRSYPEGGFARSCRGAEGQGSIVPRQVAFRPVR